MVVEVDKKNVGPDISIPLFHSAECQRISLSSPLPTNHAMALESQMSHQIFMVASSRKA